MTRRSLTALAILCVFSTAEGRSATRFTSADCHVSFEIPQKWQVTISKDSSEALCIMSVDPPNQKELTAQNDGVRVYGLTVEVTAGPFEEALKRDGGFERDGDKWYVLGRQGMRSPAEEVRGRGWRGVRGTATTGCFSDSGYAGLCDVEAAFIGNDRWAVSIYAAPQSSAEFARALTAFRFR